MLINPAMRTLALALLPHLLAGAAAAQVVLSSSVLAIQELPRGAEGVGVLTLRNASGTGNRPASSSSTCGRGQDQRSQRVRRSAPSLRG
jgi:hypothetical protein